VTSNPWLDNPDVPTKDGRIFTLRNPAIMTREISKLAEDSSLVTFRITSKNPLNPNNVPDEFETEAFAAFDRGDREFHRQTEDNSIFTYRYAAPLLTEKSCLTCHGEQGYHVGDIRGTISVAFDISEVKKTIRTDLTVIVLLSALSLLTLLSVIYLLIQRIMRELEAAHRRISQLASTDVLTDLPNRRTFFLRMEAEMDRSRRYGHHISCIMLDLDHFKDVNDTFGHDAGDLVLRETAKIVTQAKRSSDLVARYGGEELVALLPETDREGAMAVAEKMRAAIEAAVFNLSNDRKVQITVSLGVACATPDPLGNLPSSDDFLKLADNALYVAKAKGRNICICTEDLEAEA
ncbi:MAG: diguanylate cyclase, partial [Proteobacteria bacterium]|nr:diguanylate cyclase [Pseudomonadota bacterium]